MRRKGNILLPDPKDALALDVVIEKDELLLPVDLRKKATALRECGDQFVIGVPRDSAEPRTLFVRPGHAPCAPL